MGVDFETLSGVRAALGVNDVRAAGRARNYSYAYPFNIASSGLATGGSASIVQKISAAGAFVVWGAVGILHDNAGAGATIAGNKITVAWSMNDGQWQQAALPWAACVGTAVQPFYYLFRPVVAPGADLVLSLVNNTGSTVYGGITLHGMTLAAT